VLQVMREDALQVLHELRVAHVVDASVVTEEVRQDVSAPLARQVVPDGTHPTLDYFQVLQSLMLADLFLSDKGEHGSAAYPSELGLPEPTAAHQTRTQLQMQVQYEE
jgi:hypothetical protein